MKPTIIGIAGGTASGKTTIAKKLYEATKEYGNVSLIRMDDYYRRYPYIPVNNEGSKNFDHPDAYEIELLIKDLQKLQNGEPIEKPIYDFVIQNRSDKTEIVNPGVVIMVEGIMTFVNEELSNWYIRRNRRRFWGSELDNSKKAVYQTTYEVLVGICKLLAPISPYTADTIYRNLTDEKSVHLADYPVCDESMIDEHIEERMDLIIKLISMGRNSREEAKIKVRQPIGNIILDKKVQSLIGDIDSLIKEELNVKDIIYMEDLSEYMNIEYKPNFKVAGKLFGKDMKDFTNYLANISNEDVDLLNQDKLTITLNDTEYKITSDLIDKRINSKEGYNVAVENNDVIILNTELSQNLLNEGLARETISKVQNLRKTSGFDIADRINIYYASNDEYSTNIKDYLAFIREETLALNIERVSSIDEEIDINEYKVGIKLERVEK